MEPQDRSLNETLESTPAIRSQKIREALSVELGGLAKWDGKSLRFTDPNGTRKYSADDVAEVVTAELPSPFSELPDKGQMQAGAVAAWADNPAYFTKYRGSDKAEDLIRFVQRTQPLPKGTMLYRGEGFQSEAELLSRLETLKTTRRMGRLVSAFSEDQDIAGFHSTLNGSWSVVYTVTNEGAARSIMPTVAKVSPDYAAEKEALYPANTKFGVGSIEKSATHQGTVYRVQLEEETR